MDLSKIKSEPIKDDPIDKIDTLENDQLGALKQRRLWQTMRDEVIDALRKAAVKIERAKKLKKSVKDVFAMAKSIKKEKAEAEKNRKGGKSLKEFFDQTNYILREGTLYDRYDFGLNKNFNEISKDELEAIKDCIDFIKPIVSKNNKEIQSLMDVWSRTLERIIDSYPYTFDDYAKEIVSEILDAIFEFDVEESDKYMDKLDLLTSPFELSDIEIAVTPGPKEIDGDYEKY